MATTTTPAPQQQGTDLVKQQTQAIRAILDKDTFKAQLQVALSQVSVSPDFFIRVAMTAIQGDSKLLKCEPVSIAGTCIQLAQVGLVPDGFMGHAYIVPFFNKKHNQLEAKPMIGYKGYVHLAYEGEKVNRFVAQVVYEGDQFEIDLASGRPPIHIPSMSRKERGAIIGAYAVVKLATGECLVEWMTKDDIDDIRKSSQQAEGDPWTKHYDEMARKTVARRISKWTPSAKSQAAAGMEEAVESGKTRTLVSESGEFVFTQESNPDPEPLQQPQRESEKKEQVIDADKPKAETAATAPAPQSAEAAAPAAQAPAAEQKRPEDPTKISEKQIKKLFAVSRSAGVTEEQIRKFVKEKYNLDHLHDIPKDPRDTFDAILKFAGGEKLKLS